MENPGDFVDVDFYRGILEHAPWGAIVASTEFDGRCHYVNPEFIRITGYDLDHIPTVADWIHKAYPDPAYRQEILGNWTTDTSPTQMERDVVYEVVCRDGSSKQVQFRAKLLEPLRMIVMLLDVTERHEIEQELRDKEERYRLLVETSPYGIALYSDKNVDYANATALRLIGADSPEQLLGRPILDFVHPDSIPHAKKRIAEVRRRGMLAEPEEMRFVRLDGKVMDVDIQSAIVPYQGQTAIQVTFADITEQKRMEQERRALEQRMQQAQRTESLSLLAGGVAHDLNNLLVGVLGYADLAQRLVAADSTLDDYLRATMKAAEGAAELAGQLLAYAGQRKLSEQSVDLNGLVSRTEGLLRSMVDRRADLRIDLAPQIPPLQGDEVQLRQVLLNLVGNAADAMTQRQGCITVCTKEVSADDPALRDAYVPRKPGPGPYVLLEVRDEGVGMDAATRQQVFDPFFTTKASGRGLGLAAVLGIARAHDGALALDSEPGSGTTFRIYLPASWRVAVKASKPKRLAEPWRSEGTVLVVDDEPLVLRVATEMLEQLGFEVVPASHGGEALELLARRSRNIACALVDLTMPGLSGIETVRQMHIDHPDLPVVLSSGYDETATTETFRELQVAAFLPKPYNFDQLTEAMRRALDGSPGLKTSTESIV